MFGRNVGARTAVSESQWGRFVDREIMARFPEGLTVYTTAGQWRDRASNKIMREPSKVVQIVLPGYDDDMTRLGEIAETYRPVSSSNRSSRSCGRPACRFERAPVELESVRAANSVCSLPRTPGLPRSRLILRKSGKPDLRWGRTWGGGSELW